jgi:hypothetical protein
MARTRRREKKRGPSPQPSARSSSRSPSLSDSSLVNNASTLDEHPDVLGPSASRPGSPMRLHPHTLESDDSVTCQWEECGRVFTHLPALIEHIHHGEFHPPLVVSRRVVLHQSKRAPKLEILPKSLLKKLGMLGVVTRGPIYLTPPLFSNWCLGPGSDIDVFRHAWLKFTSSDHIGVQKPSYTCEWATCQRRGLQQTSRSALISHLRSHTGEKPFVCSQPGTFPFFAHLFITHLNVRLPRM